MALNRRQLLASAASMLLGPKAEAQPQGGLLPIPSGWQSLPVGGGGYVLGGSISATGLAGGAVCKIDVSGGYSWDQSALGGEGEWQQCCSRELLINTTSPSPDKSPLTDYGIWEIAGAPSNFNYQYMVYGDTQTPANYGHGRNELAVYTRTSSPNGLWTKTGLKFNALSQVWSIAGSWQGIVNTGGYAAYYKLTNQKIVVDPNNPLVAYVGMPCGVTIFGTYAGSAASVFRTLDGGANWTAVPGLPAPASLPGYAGMCIDGNSGTTTLSGVTVSNVVILPCGGYGVYRSTDGGANFTSDTNRISMPTASVTYTTTQANSLIMFFISSFGGACVDWQNPNNVISNTSYPIGSQITNFHLRCYPTSDPAILSRGTIFWAIAPSAGAYTFTINFLKNREYFGPGVIKANATNCSVSGNVLTIGGTITDGDGNPTTAAAFAAGLELSGDNPFGGHYAFYGDTGFYITQNNGDGTCNLNLSSINAYARRVNVTASERVTNQVGVVAFTGDFNTANPFDGGETSYTARIDDGSGNCIFNGRILGTTLTVNSITSGSITVGALVNGTDVLRGCTIVSSLGGNRYQVSTTQNTNAETMLASYPSGVAGNIMTVTNLGRGGVVAGQMVFGAGVSEGTTILNSPFGLQFHGVGIFTVSKIQTVASITMTSGPYNIQNPNGVGFDPIVATLHADGFPYCFAFKGSTAPDTGYSALVMGAETVGGYAENPYGFFSEISRAKITSSGSTTYQLATHSSFTGSITSSVMTVSAVASGQVMLSSTLFPTYNPIILRQLTGTAGSTGTYRTAVTRDFASTALSTYSYFVIEDAIIASTLSIDGTPQYVKTGPVAPVQPFQISAAQMSQSGTYWCIDGPTPWSSGSIWRRKSGPSSWERIDNGVQLQQQLPTVRQFGASTTVDPRSGTDPNTSRAYANNITLGGVPNLTYRGFQTTAGDGLLASMTWTGGYFDPSPRNAVITSKYVNWLAYTGTGGGGIAWGDQFIDPVTGYYCLFNAAGTFVIQSMNLSYASFAYSGYCNTQGIEASIAQDICTPPGNPNNWVMAGSQDNEVQLCSPPNFPISEVAPGGPTDGHCWQMDYATDNPAFVWALILGGGGLTSPNFSGFSINWGAVGSWYRSAALPAHSTMGGCIAVASAGGNGPNYLSSSNNTASLIIIPGNNSTPQYTTDNGNTWHSCTFSDSLSMPRNWVYLVGVGLESGSTRVVAADRVNIGTYYLFVAGADVYYSTDFGATFHPAGSNISGTTIGGGLYYSNYNLISVPGYAGHLWISCQNSDGLVRYSTDGHGTTWSTLSNITNCICATLGKSVSAGKYPSILLYGTAHTSTNKPNDTTGFFIGDAIGANISDGFTWTWFGDATTMPATNVILTADRILGAQMFGDWNVHGRLYTPYSSNGTIMYHP